MPQDAIGNGNVAITNSDGAYSERPFREVTRSAPHLKSTPAEKELGHLLVAIDAIAAASACVSAP